MKNDWTAGQFIDRTSMNQPFWLTSGTVGGTGDGANDLRVFISPGSIRYPFKSQVVASGQLQSHIVSQATAARYYTYYVRSDGTFMVSGTSTFTVPPPPRYDAEPIGTIYTGASLGTANLIGPWNQGSFGGYEQRGQMLSTMPPRITYRAYTTRAILNSGHITTLSGIAWLTTQDANAKNLATYVSASVTWQPSGTPGADGQFVLEPQFLIGNNSVLLAASLASIATDRRIFTVSQAPNGTTFITSHISAIAPSGSYNGYLLLAGLGAGGTASATIFVRDVVFSAIAGLYASDTNELT